jgi:hypothetical protein
MSKPSSQSPTRPQASATPAEALMNNSSRTLLVIALALGVACWWIAQTPDIPPGATRLIFPGLPQERVSVIQISRGQELGETLRFKAIVADTSKQTEPIWRMVKPVEDAADSATITEIPTNMGYLEYIEHLKGDSVKGLGLDKPDCKIRIEIKDSDPILLTIGPSLPGDVVGMKVAGRDGAYLIRQSFSEKFLKPLSEYRKRELFTLSFRQSDSIHVVLHRDIVGLKALEWTFVRDDRFWLIGEKNGEYGDIPNIEDLFRAMKNTRGIDVIDSELWNEQSMSKYGLKPTPAVTLNLKRGNKNEVLILGAAVPKRQNLYYARFNTRSAIYTVNLKALFKVLLKPAREFRSDSLLQLAGVPLETLTIKPAQESALVLAIAKRDWVFNNKLEIKLDQARAKKLVNDLLTLKINKLSKIKEAASFKESLLIELKAGPLTRTLQVGPKLSNKPQKNLYLVKRGERSQLYEVSLPFLESLKNAQLVLRDLQFLKFDNFSCQQIELRGPDGKVIRRLKKDESSYREDAVPIGQRDNKKMLSLIEQLKALKAQRYVALASNLSIDKHGLTEPARTFVLIQSEWDNKARRETMNTLTLWLGKPARQGTRYALLKEGDVIFELKDSFIKLLEQGFAKEKDKN